MDIFTVYMSASSQIYNIVCKLLFLRQYYLETLAKTTESKVCHIQSKQVKKTSLLNTYVRQRLGHKTHYPILSR